MKETLNHMPDETKPRQPVKNEVDYFKRADKKLKSKRHKLKILCEHSACDDDKTEEQAIQKVKSAEVEYHGALLNMRQAAAIAAQKLLEESADALTQQKAKIQLAVAEYQKLGDMVKRAKDDLDQARTRIYMELASLLVIEAKRVVPEELIEAPQQGFACVALVCVDPLSRKLITVNHDPIIHKFQCMATKPPTSLCNQLACSLANFLRDPVYGRYTRKEIYEDLKYRCEPRTHSTTAEDHDKFILGLYNPRQANDPYIFMITASLLHVKKLLSSPDEKKRIRMSKKIANTPDNAYIYEIYTRLIPNQSNEPRANPILDQDDIIQETSTNQGGFVLTQIAATGKKETAINQGGFAVTQITATGKKETPSSLWQYGSMAAVATVAATGTAALLYKKHHEQKSNALG